MMEVDQQRCSSSILQRFECDLNNLNEIINLFPSFSTPPKPKWEPCKEDFIHRKYRSALLSLGSIFAIFRVIKTADEVADTFLTVGSILSMKHEQIVEDLLRAGFLIQLETSNTCSGQREREALADVFVFIKLPQVLNRLIERGVQRQTILTALERICNCDALLDQVDAKKSDNVFRFFLDGIKKVDIINSKEHETLTKKRDLKRSLNDELPTSTSERQMIVRSELISRVQKAKRGIDTLVPENTERLLRRLLSLGEIPIDMLCSIYCACGELSLFSSKLATLNVQAQKLTSENVNTTNTQGRLLIFDSTFLLMARIQHVFSDMRLEELVGGRLNCSFYCWTQRYQKCIEEGVSMPFLFSSQINSLNDDSDETSFCSNFQHNQLQLMRTFKQPYWQEENTDFGSIIETIPLIGQILLEEFTHGSPNLTEIFNIFWTFSQMNCLWLCLVQWLDTQQSNVLPRQAMARAMKEFEIKLQQQKTLSEKDNNNKDNNNNNERLQSLNYSILIARSLLYQIAGQKIKKEHPYTWLIGFVQRPLPALPMGRKMSLLRADREEIKEENQRLKEVFLCANQQGWATPDAIAHINRCNESCRMDIWLQCWMRQMMNHQRIVTVDEGELASELCLAATITYPVPCLCEMIKQLVECILFERPTSTSSNNTTTSTISSSASAPNIISSNVSNTTTNSSEQEQKHVTQQQINSSQQKHSVPTIDSQQQQHLIQQHTKPSSLSHPALTQLIITRHPVVGQLSTKATVIAKMLVRAMQLLLWAGDRRAVEKIERERRIQQFGLVTQQQPSTSLELLQTCRKRKQQQEEETPESKEEEQKQTCISSFTQQQDEAIDKQNIDLTSSTIITENTFFNDLTTPRLPKDALKAQLTVRNVFERFERIVREFNLRPPVTFIIFFIHELAAAPRTEYWQRLVSIMPVNLIFALAYIDPHAIPLELFMQLYNPENEKNRKLCILM
ncbi:hypothetical protein Mgra_00006611 [Meloidogyne graminicola]|uniref:Mediator of RNA polymerase II transcription subunit 24 n=1 Tax=Meloidogyne graminicola TaxID=189291 RepID=A0A8S9ZL18_9BILA|nr:hypothetical protein Mgra_00006611 [Meloidogyne graminicola]